MKNLMDALSVIKRAMFGGKAKHFEIGGYLASGSAIVYSGSRPAVYNEEADA